MTKKQFKAAFILWTAFAIVSLTLYAYYSSEWFIKRADVVAKMLNNAQYISNGGKMVFMAMDLFIVGYYFVALLVVHFTYGLFEKK